MQLHYIQIFWNMTDNTILHPKYNTIAHSRLAPLNKMAEASKALFQFFDENNDGGITLVELKEAMAGVGVKFSEEEVTKFFNKVKFYSNICFTPLHLSSTYVYCPKNGLRITGFER